MISRLFALALTCLVAAGPTSLWAQSMIWETAELSTSNSLLGVFVADDHFVAHGLGGIVVASQDGRVWRDVSPPVAADLRIGLSWQDAWIVAERTAGIWVTTDQGQTWVEADLPEEEGQVFQPGYIVAHDGSLVAAGTLSSVCRNVFARSENGLDWSLIADWQIFGWAFQMISTGTGLAVTTNTRSPPCGGGLGGSDFVHYQASLENGLEPQNYLGTPPTTTASGMVWNNDALWVLSNGFTYPPPGFYPAVRHMQATDNESDAVFIELNSAPRGIFAYGEQVLVRHEDYLSIIDKTGVVSEEPFPLSDKVYRFAVKGNVLVGVGTDGAAIRGTPVAAQAIPSTGWLALFSLFLLLGLSAKSLLATDSRVGSR